MKLTGLYAWIFYDSFDPARVISGPRSTAAKRWYTVIEKAKESNIPVPVGAPFMAPEGQQITIYAGERLYPIDPQRFCKTGASFSMDQGTIDVGDDCDPGATILDGVIGITGSLNGMLRFDEETGDFDGVTEDIFLRFMDVIEDDGDGKYTIKPRTDDQIFMLINLNSKAKIGQIETFIYLPVNISGASMNIGNSEVMGKEMSWSKGEGMPVIYKRPKTEA